tara:strand:+ start:646 stop:1077 length:432 start_codon:yes stop_codon:yes gene_type:complete
MAIKVGGTTVVDDSRNLTNVVSATLTGTLQTQKIAETLVAVGNSSTAATLNLSSGTVFTVTLTGSATLTVSNPTNVASFTVILTNDGTAGRTVAWAGGSFVFPGGAATLSRTTAANGVDVWVFFSPNGGTTWYGNIAMKNMIA